MHPQESHHRQCRSQPFCRDFFNHYLTSTIEAGKSINRHIPRTKCTYEGSGMIHAICTIHIERCHRWQFQSQLPSTRLNLVTYGMVDVSNLPNRLRKSHKAKYCWPVTESTMITNMITGIISHWTGTVQHRGAAIAERVAAPIGMYNNPWMFQRG